MREERGPAQALTCGSAPPDRSPLRPARISNRNSPGLEFPVTYSKQRTGALFNRNRIACSLSSSAHPLSSSGGIFLTPQPRLLYISWVLEETVGLCPASNSGYRRGASFVGAGIGHGFKDSSYTSVQRLFRDNAAGVSLPGIFASADCSARTARPHKSEEA